MLPLFLVGIVVAALVIWRIETHSQERLRAGFIERAELLAGVVDNAAEVIVFQNVLRQLVGRLGVERDVLSVVVVGG